MTGLAGVVVLGDRPVDADDVRCAARMQAALDPERRSANRAVVRQHGNAVLVGQQRCGGEERGAEAEHLAAVVAGRIDNGGAVRAELEAIGAPHPMPDDAALLREAFRAWGPGAVTRLNGAFAFAIHDARAGTLTCGRDRFGIEPLHYALLGGRFLFASELAVLAAAAPVLRRNPDYEALAHYLVFGFCPTDRSALRGVGRLTPAHILHVDRSGAIRRERYWRLAPMTSGEPRRSSADLAAELRARLDRTVAPSLEGDAPVGVLITEGCAPAALAAVAARGRPSGLHTFALNATPGDGTSSVETSVGLHHAVSLDGAAATEALELIPRRGEPLAVLEALSFQALLRAANGRVSTCLISAGGDEYLLGNDRYGQFEARLQDHAEVRFQTSTQQGFHQTPPFLRDLYCDFVSVFSDAECLLLAGATMAPGLMFSPADEIGPELEDATSENAQDRAARVDVTHGAARMLAAFDVARYRAGPKVLAPLLRHHDADWCAALPQAVRLTAENGAPSPAGLLRSAITQPSPSTKLIAPRLGTGVDACLRTGLRERLEDTFASSTFRSRGLFCLPRVDRLLRDHLAAKRSNGAQLWALLCLETWFETFVGGSSVERSPEPEGAL